MKKFIKIILIIISSFFIIGATPINFNKDEIAYYKLENNMVDECDFVQNGVRMEYYSKNIIEEEYNRILQSVEKIFGDNIQINYNEIVYKDSQKTVKVVMWNENDETRVQISYLNNLDDRSSLQLKSELDEILNNKSHNVIYYSFFKGKIKSERKNYVQDILMSNIKKDTMEILSIHNGYVAKAILNDNQRVNIGYMKYNTGEYLIIGSPRIFITY